MFSGPIVRSMTGFKSRQPGCLPALGHSPLLSFLRPPTSIPGASQGHFSGSLRVRGFQSHSHSKSVQDQGCKAVYRGEKKRPSHLPGPPCLQTAEVGAEHTLSGSRATILPSERICPGPAYSNSGGLWGPLHYPLASVLLSRHKVLFCRN